MPIKILYKILAQLLIVFRNKFSKAVEKFKNQVRKRSNTICAHAKHLQIAQAKLPGDSAPLISVLSVTPADDSNQGGGWDEAADTGTVGLVALTYANTRGVTLADVQDKLRDVDGLYVDNAIGNMDGRQKRNFANK